MKCDPYLEYPYMEKAAKLGLIEAQHNFGKIYFTGIVSNPEVGMKVADEKKALSW